jgi:RNA polymerase sigma-70 factor (ECF subfamily)
MTEERFHKEYLSLSDTLYRIAFYMLESQAEAEDAVQEVYLKLWDTRNALDGIRSPKAYSVTLLKNLCLDRIRRASRLTFPEQLPETEKSQLQDDGMDARMRLEKVLEAVKALPDRQREILLLRTVEGLSYEEIAQRTGMNYLTLRVLLSRARSTIKSKI